MTPSETCRRHLPGSPQLLSGEPKGGVKDRRRGPEGEVPLLASKQLSLSALALHESVFHLLAGVRPSSLESHSDEALNLRYFSKVLWGKT